MDNTLIKDIQIKERPRERFKLYGKENVSNEELLSIILNTGVKNKSVKEFCFKNNLDERQLGHVAFVFVNTKDDKG